jgi:hypothetical protein
VPGDVCSSGRCGELDPQACRVNAVIDQLHTATPRVKTFVVGFAFGSAISGNLNCHAVHGHTARRNQGNCADLDAATCRSDGDAACYYKAETSQDLEAALDEILSQVASCSYRLPNIPPDASRLYAYLETGAGRRRIDLGIQWEYDAALTQVTFLDQSCSAIKGGAVPLVVYGCIEEGG